MTDGSGALVGSTAYDAFGAVRSQTGRSSVLGYTGELYTPATGLLHLRARDLNPTLGRFLSVDTVQPNAPGSQGFNLYAYVANNPTTWVDPSGHNAIGEAMPLLPGAVFRMADALALLIPMTLALGRNVASWAFGRHRDTSITVLAVFGLVLACGTTPHCMSAVAGIGNTMTQLGSDAAAGVVAWSATMLQDATRAYPTLPTIDQPVAESGSILNNPLGPWLQACMLGGILTGVANLTADAYGYHGTAAENATIVANVMYNVVTCGGAGGSDGGSSGGNSSENSGGNGHWLGQGRPPQWGVALAEYIDNVYKRMPFWQRNNSTAAVVKINGQYYVSSAGDSRAAQYLSENAQKFGYTYLPNTTTDHAEKFLYNYFGGKVDGIGVSHQGGPCGPSKKDCLGFFRNEGFVNVFWTGTWK